MTRYLPDPPESFKKLVAAFPLISQLRCQSTAARELTISCTQLTPPRDPRPRLRRGRCSGYVGIRAAGTRSMASLTLLLDRAADGPGLSGSPASFDVECLKHQAWLRFNDVDFAVKNVDSAYCAPSGASSTNLARSVALTESLQNACQRSI